MFNRSPHGKKTDRKTDKSILSGHWEFSDGWKKQGLEFQLVEKTIQSPAVEECYLRVIMSVNKQREKRRARRGQVMLEYVVAVGVFVAMVAVTAMLLYAFKSYGGRVLSLMASA